ncbi:zinc C3HC4 type RING finger domain-containing protein protein [Babesia ovis]|uniref:Zinc C3HC4 type RING finger domain-containing protein protein n=1 Tax=Babesia ovis TaxID=5869 RepID=A0A9W5TE44_BABOV|nr:zinc C3HC4 type RING finger domain-containing protein protein [Babesia ovis]
MDAAEALADERREASLGDRLRSRYWWMRSLTEYCIGLDTYATRRTTLRQPDSDLLMDFVVLQPVKALNFVRGAILCGVVTNALLCAPDGAIGMFYKHVSTKYDTIVWWWLVVNKLLQLFQMPIRIFMLYLMRKLRGSSHQEIMYCMAVITTSKLWRWSKRFTLANYFWYALGFAASRNPIIISKPWFNIMVVYVFSVIAMRVAFTFVLFYYAFPPSQMRVVQKPQPKVDTSKIPIHKFGELKNPTSTMCGICLEEFDDDALIRLLQCSHGYHVACIDKWFARSNTCPLCLSEVD